MEVLVHSKKKMESYAVLPKSRQVERDVVNTKNSAPRAAALSIDRRPRKALGCFPWSLVVVSSARPTCERSWTLPSARAASVMGKVMKKGRQLKKHPLSLSLELGDNRKVKLPPNDFEKCEVVA